MSRMNRIRIINLSYNSNTIRIDDETFDLNGETTLLSLRNGGGKTVLVQMVISLFVNSSYRNFTDRSFHSYFTTNKPTFIMTEWKLDHDNGYFLVGMMVRKSQIQEENNNEELEILTFTGSYKTGCGYDLDTIPLLENQEGNKALKGFGTCKKLFEELKLKDKSDFNYYDMSSVYYRRQYFSKLKEYQIDNREWESIIKKVNLKESGLSELFANAKDEKGLIENWFIDAIQNKLNGNHDRIKEFQKIAYKLIGQYQDNQTSIRRKSVIEEYFEDAKQIMEQLEKYEVAQNRFDLQKSKIAAYRMKISSLLDQTKQRIAVDNDTIVELNSTLNQVIREQFSYTIYELMDKKSEAIIDRTELEVHIIQSRALKEKMQEEICLYDCAGIYKEMKDFADERDMLQSKIRIATSDQKNTEEKVDKIGSALYSFYLRSYEKKAEKLDEITTLIDKLNDEKADNSNNRDDIQAQIEDMQQKKGGLEAVIDEFDKVEIRFNTTFQENLARNILGDYEDGILQVKNSQYEDECTKAQTSVMKLAQKYNLLKEEDESLIRKCEQIKSEEVRIDEQKNQLSNEYENLLSEKTTRLLYIKYVDVPESELDNKNLILSRFDEKIKHLESQKDQFKEQFLLRTKEYENLKQGKVIELPDNVKEYFEEENIEYIYGMDWLKHNSKSVTENQKLVERNPFIPYCIILNAQTAKRLREGRSDVYTGFPIPIVIREDLEQNYQSSGGCINIGKVNFFVVFNCHLLDGLQLDKLLNERKEQLAILQERILQKENELVTYREYRSELFQQIYTESLLNEKNTAIHNREIQYQELSQHYQDYSNRRKEITTIGKNILKSLDERKETIEKIKQRNVSFHELLKEYEDYRKHFQEKTRIDLKLIEARKQLSEVKNNLYELEHQYQIINEKRRSYEDTKKGYRSKLDFYANYKGYTTDICCNQECVIALEEEYRSLTQGIALTIQELQRSLEIAIRRYDDKYQELQRKNQYNFSEEMYMSLEKTEPIMQGLKDNLERAQIEEDMANNRTNKLTALITRISDQIGNEEERLIDKIGDATLVERRAIIDLDFKGRMSLVNYQVGKKEQERDQLIKKESIYQQAENIMAEYEEYEVVLDVEIQDIEEMNEEEIRKYQGELRRDLMKYKEYISREEKHTDTCIRNISMKDIYSEEYFNKSFKNMLSVVDNVHNVKEQLEVNCQAYNNTMKKLQVDLENIEKERTTVEESFLEYVKSIDDNMRMIDKNSTIKIRGKSLKMLKVIVPDWESNKERYVVNLRDYVDNFIKWGIEAVENNKNVEELLGKLITTKKLYNDIVGIGNIEIRMFKIEEEREVPITWSDVSANSGGEGFLSAFVILTCLLSYMRRDEADLFFQGEEGKVLIMDNPFAQTNAVHLLKPLMDIAKKTNTQLICLSGLGGDSIYNRFDNIYVLKLKQSNLKKGLQYLDTEHIKGESIKKMQLAQFKIEQMSLFDIE